jgi:hypothetical protein
MSMPTLDDSCCSDDTARGATDKPTGAIVGAANACRFVS